MIYDATGREVINGTSADDSAAYALAAKLVIGTAALPVNLGESLAAAPDGDTPPVGWTFGNTEWSRARELLEVAATIQAMCRSWVDSDNRRGEEP